MLFRHFTTLLDETDAADVDLQGNTILVNPLPGDRVFDHEQEVVVVVSGTQSGGSAPTLTVVVETSSDNEVWHTVYSKAFGDADSDFQDLGGVALFNMGPNGVLKFVRARTELGGTANPTQDRVKVELGSTAPLRGQVV